MKGVQGHFHNLTVLIKLQMAPHNEQSMEAITNKDFFTNIGRDGYPSSNKTQAQPWKKVWNGTQGRNVQADGKMVVACALRHDYGMQQPCLYLQTSANPHRLLWSWRLLVVPINLSGCGVHTLRSTISAMNQVTKSHSQLLLTLVNTLFFSQGCEFCLIPLHLRGVANFPIPRYPNRWRKFQGYRTAWYAHSPPIQLLRHAFRAGEFTGVVAIALLNSLIFNSDQSRVLRTKCDLHMQALWPWQRSLSGLAVPYAPFVWHPTTHALRSHALLVFITHNLPFLHDTPRAPNESEPNQISHVHASRGLPTQANNKSSPPPLPDIVCTSASTTFSVFSPALLLKLSYLSSKAQI
jgi:hypothetical protein